MMFIMMLSRILLQDMAGDLAGTRDVDMVNTDAKDPLAVPFGPRLDSPLN